MIHLVLHQPEIPHNTGAVGRLALASGARLHLIKPLGFSLEDKHLKRCGLDYWKEVDLRVWDHWQDLRQEASPKACFFPVEVGGGTAYCEADMASPSELYLIFGPETSSLPAEAMQSGQSLHLPMQGTRSLNLATAVAICLYEALRQRGFPGMGR